MKMAPMQWNAKAQNLAAPCLEARGTGMIEMRGDEKKRRPNSPLLGFSFSRNQLKRWPPKGASSREKLPAPWTKSHAAFLGGGMAACDIALLSV